MPRQDALPSKETNIDLANEQIDILSEEMAKIAVAAGRSKDGSGWDCDWFALGDEVKELLRSPAPSSSQGWIACSERTPDEQYDVLVTDGQFVGIGDCCKGHLWNSPFELVTHWMELPEPPQAQG